MSNTHQELASPEANGFCKELDSPKKKALGKDISNPLMAGRLPKTTLPTRLGRIIANIDEDVQINSEEAQAKPYKMELEHQEKVLSMQDVDDEETADVEEVLKVVKAAKLMIEVVTIAGVTANAEATKFSVPRRRRGVVIQDPEETTSTVVMHYEVQSKDKGKGILIEEPKSLKGRALIEQDEAFARQLEAELNADINWNFVMEQVKRSERLNDAVMKYQDLKRKPLTEAQSRKNITIYLKNMVGFKMNYFKGITYSEIRPLFKKNYNHNQALLEEVNEEVILPEKEVEVKAHKRECESLEKEIRKKQKMDEEAEELRSHFLIVSNDDDDDMGYEKLSEKLTFYKAFFLPQWKFFIHTILQCLSAKTTSWNEFSSTMAFEIICLGTNQKFNFSRYILLSLVKNIEAGVPFFMFPKLVQLLIDHQLGDMSHHKDIYDNPCLTKKVFANMKRVGTSFSGVVTALFDNMLVPDAKEDLHSVNSKVYIVAPVVEKEKSFKQGRIIANIDEDVEINSEEAQAKPYKMELEHQEKIRSRESLEACQRKPDVEASVWRDQKGRYGLAKRYLLTHFTLEQMLNNVRLEVEGESEMSLEVSKKTVE
nr:hypothetical protein [Tanacetum cinerariifolium]